MYELSTIYPDISGLQPEYGWASHYTRTTDGLPYIGPHRNFPFHLFAFGDSSRSVTGAYLASRLLLRRHLEGFDSGDEAFAFTWQGQRAALSPRHSGEELVPFNSGATLLSDAPVPPLNAAGTAQRAVPTGKTRRQ